MSDPTWKAGDHVGYFMRPNVIRRAVVLKYSPPTRGSRFAGYVIAPYDDDGVRKFRPRRVACYSLSSADTANFGIPPSDGESL